MGSACDRVRGQSRGSVTPRRELLSRLAVTSLVQRKLRPVFAAAVVTFLYALSGGKDAAADPASASDCVTILRSENATGLDLRVNNACEKNLACDLRWTVSCETSKGAVTATRAGASRVNVAAAGQSQLSASAAACKEGWSVSDVTWTCAPR